MIYNEIKEPLFVHFYFESIDGSNAMCSDKTADVVYNAVTEGTPVVGIFHPAFSEEFATVYSADEAYSIINNGGALETPCIIDYAQNGQYIPLLDAPSGMTFSLLSLIYNWMQNDNNYDVLLRAKLHNNSDCELYKFEYNWVMEGQDGIYFYAQSYTFNLSSNGDSAPTVLHYDAYDNSDAYILPVFTTAKCELEPGEYTYYAAFQTFGKSSPYVIQMKNSMVRLAEAINDDMLNWSDSPSPGPK